MARNTPVEPDKSEVAPNPEVNPKLARQQELQQQYQQITTRTMDLRNQRQLVDDLITDATIQAAELRGALKEIQKG